MKRKADTQEQVVKKPLKKRSKTALSEEETKKRFRNGLFDKEVLDKYTSQYQTSTPYRHSVISELVDDKLLRSVRDEIRANVSFMPKETDIYKIHQSGDLANLDGLEDEALAKLPSLLSLRDAVYSETFRNYVSHITGCGPLSGRKTDIAINVYTPGCFLLCHDDVIGSRKVSYILYLVDPDVPWKSEWGGALRLFPVTEKAGRDGAVAKTVEPDVVKVIPPAWNQLSFFAVQPGESFHDVEEVYHAESKAQLAREGGRIRMAISGWFHIPQLGEEGYVEGAEEAQARNSGLMQLKGDPDQHDLPREVGVPVEDEDESQSLLEFDESDFEFLLRYISPTYLTPDTLERVSEYFGEDSSMSVTLPDILNAKFAARLREHVTKLEASGLPEGGTVEIEKKTPWKVARPPQKHRFLYMRSGDGTTDGDDGEPSPIRELIDTLIPSRPFRAWLQMATRRVIRSHFALARRFRRGEDYTLAMGHGGEPRLELNLGFTPTNGWGEDDADAAAEEEDEEDEDEDVLYKGGSSSKARGRGEQKGKNSTSVKKTNGKEKDIKGKGKTKAVEEDDDDDREQEDAKEDEEDDVGGTEVYIEGDEDGTEDAAVYKSARDPDADDNILFFQAAAWNKLTIVQRDSGALRFVKYVSRRAKGDRWDVSAHFDIDDQDDDGDDDDQRREAEVGAGVLDSSTEDEFRGFSTSEDSDSD